jgi:hypothetical protein
MANFKKIVLTGKHGRPSTKLVHSQGTAKDAVLIQRRQMPWKAKNGVVPQYYRVFEDRQTLIPRVEDKKYLFEYKAAELNLDGSILIRWGTREQVQMNNSVVYNKIAGLENATNKLKSRQLFIEKGVSCPKLVTPANFAPADLPVIARPFEHSKGKNFIVLKSKADFVNHYNTKKYYYSQFIDKSREFRIHAGHNKALAVMEKCKPEGTGIAWNRAQNDVDPFEYIKWGDVDAQNLKCVIDAALQAIQAVGLDMGGVDVMYKDGKAYVLEVNTAPTLNTSPYVAKRWAMYFDWIFAEDKAKKTKRREHWATDQMKKGSSLIWKNYQLRDEKEPNK